MAIEADPGLANLPGDDTPENDGCQVVLSFDVEEHDRIEAAAGLSIGPALKERYRARLGPPTFWLLDELGRRNIRAMFFIVGQIAEHTPSLVRAIHRAGHEVASHSWSHRRVHDLTPESFQEDIRCGKDALEQVTGEAVVGYRAPTFSVVRRTAWAIDVLSESGMLYDSSIYPVRHDRYGIPQAPRRPFLARGTGCTTLLEFPPATLGLGSVNVPAGGGGYFRLLPLVLIRRALGQLLRDGRPPVAMLYFHPWEFDPEQPRLPLRPTSRWRTYVGLGRSRDRFRRLIVGYQFTRAVDAARSLEGRRHPLPTFDPAAGAGLSADAI
jgi:polysaccharide deacetylase family protein (PEP-CTERM system associated)